MFKEHFEETGSNLSKLLIENYDEELKNFVQVCPKEICNVTGDSQMEAMKRQLEQAFHVSGERSLNLDQIKNSPTLREETRAKVTAAIAALPSLDM